eukprot:1572881-Rhodomonas_salina.2
MYEDTGIKFRTTVGVFINGQSRQGEPENGRLLQQLVHQRHADSDGCLAKRHRKAAGNGGAAAHDSAAG